MQILNTETLIKAIDILDFSTVKILLYAGADPNILSKEMFRGHPIYIATCSPIEKRNTNNPNLKYGLDIIKVLLEHSAYASVNKCEVNFGCLSLVLASNSLNMPLINLLLDNGADPASREKDNWRAIDYLHLLKHKEDFDYTAAEDLLNPYSPPYLNLGTSTADKYIIYENTNINAIATPYLLTDKQKHPTKKYLYADNKIDAFVYWCYTKGLLIDSLSPVIKTYIEKHDMSQYKNMNLFLKSTLEDTLTTDYFNEAGKEFAIAYLTVTHWWYNLHTDFNRLYQEDGIKLPCAIQSQEEFDTLMKLLDIRYEQFKSGKDFNSNQNKAELEALIEGREAPKRVVDLSFLEEDIETPTSQQSDNILPEDFMK